MVVVTKKFPIQKNFYFENLSDPFLKKKIHNFSEISPHRNPQYILSPSKLVQPFTRKKKFFDVLLTTITPPNFCFRPDILGNLIVHQYKLRVKILDRIGQGQVSNAYPAMTFKRIQSHTTVSIRVEFILKRLNGTYKIGKYKIVVF